MSATRKRYTDEFKRNAVLMILEKGYRTGEVAQNLGINDNMLRRWRQEYAAAPTQAFPGKGHLKPEDEERRRLQRELTRVTEERDILKKALAYFAEAQKR